MADDSVQTGECEVQADVDYAVGLRRVCSSVPANVSNHSYFTGTDLKSDTLLYFIFELLVIKLLAFEPAFKSNP